MVLLVVVPVIVIQQEIFLEELVELMVMMVVLDQVLEVILLEELVAVPVEQVLLDLDRLVVRVDLVT